MKKIGLQLLCLVCVFMLMMSSGLAAAPTVTSTLPQDVVSGHPETIFQIRYQGSAYDWRIDRIEDGITRPATEENWSLSDPLGESNLAGDTNVIWDYFNYGDYSAYDGGVDHQLVVTVDGVPTTVVDFYVNYFANHNFDRVSLESWQELTDGTLIPIDPSIGITEEPAPLEGVYYANNTVCSFGPHFRNLTPDLTKKWYMFTALDLSQNGVQEYELVAGNMFVVGRVYVTVDGDNVTVSYKYNNGEIYNHGDFFTIFPDYKSVTTVEPSEIENAMEYDKTYSIANDLNGDKEVLLFICNVVTFRDDNPSIVRFWENIPERKALRESMLEAIGMSEAE